MSSLYTSTDYVSAIGSPVNEALRKRPYAPLGSAVWTSSGNLTDTGIAAIAQAATGTMVPHVISGGEPTLESVENSIINSLALAAVHKRMRLAIPFIASGIFLSRIKSSKGELAKVIVQAAQDHCGNVQPVIVAYGDTDKGLFKVAIEDLGADNVQLVEGSVTDFELHKCDAIVNAANMEVEFGGGMSGIIGKATGEPEIIDPEALEKVKNFWKANLPKK